MVWHQKVNSRKTCSYVHQLFWHFCAGETLIFIASEYIESRMQGAPHLKNLHLIDIMREKYNDDDPASMKVTSRSDESCWSLQSAGPCCSSMKSFTMGKTIRKHLDGSYTTRLQSLVESERCIKYEQSQCTQKNKNFKLTTTILASFCRKCRSKNCRHRYRTSRSSSHDRCWRCHRRRRSSQGSRPHTHTFQKPLCSQPWPHATPVLFFRAGHFQSTRASAPGWTGYLHHATRRHSSPNHRASW